MSSENSSAPVSNSRARTNNRNASGTRTDLGWEHGVDVDGNGKKVKCKYCLKDYNGGIYCLKNHLAGTRNNVEACVKVTDEVRAKMIYLLNANIEAKSTKKRAIHDSGEGTVFLESEDTSEFSKNAQKVFEMLDNIVEMVGEENVIQIVTDNASAYKAAGDLLMEKRKHLFWTPCAAHCIDLMLEDFDKNIKVHKSTIVKAKKITNFIYARSMLISIMKEFTENRDLIRPAVTRFATSYLTLGCLNEHKGELMTMFSSEKWRKSKFSSLPDGKRVQGIVLDGRFWNNVAYCLRAMMPLVKVLRMVDSDERPAMPFLFFELNNANEKIKSNFNNVESR
ncbi:hypothetical protein LINGRAHAP2_LOCUS31490 [Linum grandiflorum]